MPRVNRFGLLERRRSGQDRLDCFLGWRDWWLGKNTINLGVVILPREYWGKHIRFRVEVVVDGS